MPTLASKLPYDHPFAGGYPRLGGQPLPTDPDAIDYLERVAAADGAAVEVGVAMAVDAFVKGCKADGTWDAIKASCLLCGPRTLSGALVPLVGTAPTSYAFASGDYNRVTGLKGDGSTTYLDSNRANDSDGQDDNHNALYYSYVNANSGKIDIGAGGAGAGANNFAQAAATLFIRSRSTANLSVGTSGHTGLGGFSRGSSSGVSYRINGTTGTSSLTSESPTSDNIYVFGRNSGGDVMQAPTDARLAFYSIGASLDLAALDTRVSAYVAAVAAAL